MSPLNPVEKYDGDVYLYYGDISRAGYGHLSGVFEAKADKKDKVCLILITHGGDPDAAYRIARATNHHYKNFEILIPDICKSAGTLVCIGAHKLIFGDRGELGPPDIQISKPDEMFESMSGLDIIQALNALQNQVLDSFRSYLIDIRNGSRLRTKLAADIAAQLAGVFIAPISAKIDPVTLGEHQRAMQIAYDYGERLSGMANSLLDDALVKLVSSYPSHGFVIDRKEAATLFKNVEAPSEMTRGLYIWARQLVAAMSVRQDPLVVDVSIACGLENQALGASDESKSADEQSSQSDESSIDGGAKKEGASNEPDDNEPGQ